MVQFWVQVQGLGLLFFLSGAPSQSHHKPGQELFFAKGLQLQLSVAARPSCKGALRTSRFQASMYVCIYIYMPMPSAFGSPLWPDSAAPSHLSCGSWADDFVRMTGQSCRRSLTARVVQVVKV